MDYDQQDVCQLGNYDKTFMLNFYEQVANFFYVYLLQYIGSRIDSLDFCMNGGEELLLHLEDPVVYKEFAGGYLLNIFKHCTNWNNLKIQESNLELLTGGETIQSRSADTALIVVVVVDVDVTSIDNHLID